MTPILACYATNPLSGLHSDTLECAWRIDHGYGDPEGSREKVLAEKWAEPHIEAIKTKFNFLLPCTL